jgi:hypothetical protein
MLFESNSGGGKRTNHSFLWNYEFCSFVAVANLKRTIKSLHCGHSGPVVNCRILN